MNSITYDLQQDKCLHELFEEQVVKTPDKVALVASDKTLTYRKLNEEANKIAHSLIEKGVKVGDIVAFVLNRRSYVLSTMFGILKTGASYLPIDPDYPQDRIEYVLNNSNAKFCITEENINELLNNTNTENPNIETTNDSICYCIYTSGSTGNPKGTLLTHRNVVNYVSRNEHNVLGGIIKEEQKILSVTTIGFDIFVTESLLPLTNGLTVILADDEEARVQSKLAKLIISTKAEVIQTTPTKMKTFISNKDNLDYLKELKIIILGGETLDKSLADELKEITNAKLFNIYGPTETTVWSTYADITDAQDITIGRPIANTQIYILDKYSNPVPIGVTGELCIAGDGVCAGYLNNEELTNEKFIPNPFGKGKLYKTGDHAYWREDGNVVFIGRKDFQVKIRGLRIELGEIESALQTVEGVERAVVVVRKDDEDRQLLCAFYTGKEIDAKDLRTILSSKLPKYMVPHIFTHLEEMPLTSSGKANRNALPEIDLTNINTETEYVAPTTEKEIALSKAISIVLNVEKVSMLDNFFNIGGDSINAIYLVSELEDMNYSLQVADIMQSDTLSDIVLCMVSTSNEDIYDQNEINDLIPFTPIMRAYLKERKTIAKDFVHTCIISVDYNEDIIKQVLDILVSHHDILRGVFTADGIGIIPSDKRQAYSFQSIIINDKDEATEYLKNTSLDDKLVKVIFCKTGTENLLCITVHHFLIDLVSWEMLMRDFTIVINQISYGKKPSLSAKSASFKLWNEELEKYAETMPEDNKEYWNSVNQKLDNAKSFNACEDENASEEFTFTFDKDISSKLINKVNTTYGTRINEVLVTALGLAAGNLAGGSVGIMVESHGRTPLHKHIAIEHTIGWFTSCYPVVINNSGNIADDLINTKETLRRIPKNGVEYLLLSDGFHNNTDIIFNFYRNSISNENRENELVAFAGNSVFPGKINVSCFVSDDILSIGISVPVCKHKPNISEELGLEFVAQIQNIVDFCTGTNKIIKTRSDFSDASLTQSELDELTDLFD